MCRQVQHYASHHPGEHPDARNLDDSGDDKDGNRSIALDDLRGRSELMSSRWVTGRDGQVGSRWGTGCSPPFGAARNNHQC